MRLNAASWTGTHLLSTGWPSTKPTMLQFALDEFETGSSAIKVRMARPSVDDVPYSKVLQEFCHLSLPVLGREEGNIIIPI